MIINILKAQPLIMNKEFINILLFISLSLIRCNIHKIKKNNCYDKYPKKIQKIIDNSLSINQNKLLILEVSGSQVANKKTILFGLKDTIYTLKEEIFYQNIYYTNKTCENYYEFIKKYQLHRNDSTNKATIENHICHECDWFILFLLKKDSLGIITCDTIYKGDG